MIYRVRKGLHMYPTYADPAQHIIAAAIGSTADDLDNPDLDLSDVDDLDRDMSDVDDIDRDLFDGHDRDRDQSDRDDLL